MNGHMGIASLTQVNANGTVVDFVRHDERYMRGKKEVMWKMEMYEEMEEEGKGR